jgi:hypothetical protein
LKNLKEHLAEDKKEQERKDVMKNFFLVMFTCLLLLPLSCGSGDSSSSGGSQTNSNAIISVLSISPTQASLDQGGGTITVTMTFYFTDNQGDLSTITVFYTDPNGKTITHDPISSGVSGVTSGQIWLYYPQPTSAKGNWTVGVYATDASGRNSNQLTTTLTVS